jgi:hypothetical protein
MTDIQRLKVMAERCIENAGAGSGIPIRASLVLDLIIENERLQCFETAYKEFSDKTDWVQETAHWSELGLHRADVLHKRCDDLTAHCQAQADEIVRLRKDRDRLAADYAALAEDPGSAL